MARGGARPGAGRPKNTANGPTLEAKRFVERVEKRLRENGALHGLEDWAVTLLQCGDPKVSVIVWKHLVEMYHGKPRQAVELSGEEGRDITFQIVHVGGE